jgi:flagellar secretion chaperone FliS
MYERSNAVTSYGRVANAETNPLQQVVMLYDGAIKFLQLAAANIEARDFVHKSEHVNRALDIVNYLQAILDFERGGEVAQTLDRLYTVVSMNILRASAKLDAGEMRRAAQLLSPVRDSWDVIARSGAETVAAKAGSSDSAPARLGQMVMA